MKENPGFSAFHRVKMDKKFFLAGVVIIVAISISLILLTQKSPVDIEKEKAKENACKVLCENILEKPASCNNINYSSPDIANYCSSCKAYLCNIDSQQGDSCKLSC